jgi:hypothetical protein
MTTDPSLDPTWALHYDTTTLRHCDTTTFGVEGGLVSVSAKWKRQGQGQGGGEAGWVESDWSGVGWQLHNGIGQSPVSCPVHGTRDMMCS